MVQYRITWRNLLTDYQGNGDWFKSKDKQLLEDWIQYLNKEYTDLNHWLEKK